MNTNKLGGRKFILALLSLNFVISIFIVMLIKKWLNAGYCMQFVTYIPIIMGLFVGGNIAEKLIAKKNGGK